MHWRSATQHNCISVLTKYCTNKKAKFTYIRCIQLRSIWRILYFSLSYRFHTRCCNTIFAQKWVISRSLLYLILTTGQVFLWLSTKTLFIQKFNREEISCLFLNNYEEFNGTLIDKINVLHVFLRQSNLTQMIWSRRFRNQGSHELTFRCIVILYKVKVQCNFQETHSLVNLH